MQDRPLNVSIMPQYASPEMGSLDPDSPVDGCAHDMWSFGYLVAVMFGHNPIWRFSSDDPDKDYQDLCQAHESWVSGSCSYTVSCVVP